ncbi:hypothetical protein HG536_0F02070 [Torulaspora globosa]|uniref:Protein kinase domain-containing protein n=1 Tax=Torulaspora globosa TaxID=48254 RepID=A0A7G3ZK46_9SACH|nr:uncharacterized protein HG536_0F02070 [Torulaspora globosa]QLL33882.1 hypothetical protein HG536_0F02070 [Torulaspora globosa]
MSLVPYKEGSVILDDPTSRSLVIVYPSNGSLEFFEKVFDTETGDVDSSWNQAAKASIASFVCPQCGTEVNPSVGDVTEVKDASVGGNNVLEVLKEPRTSRRLRPKGILSRKYFKLLESSHRHYSLEQNERPALGPQHQFFLPDNLFIPGYFHKFFKTLSLLGNGARGSVYKVVHKIGDIELGIFAVKKIPIGNDMAWFQKCIREVKALSSLTNRSANLITYNHVWLEMNTACGLVRTLDGRQLDAVEDIPCIFILQEYCSGGNLEDFIFKDVFHKFQDLQSPKERKKKFLYRRSHPNEALGLSTEQIVSILKDLATGLQELHDIGLIHRDLKPSNCLLLEENIEERPIAEYYPTIIIGDLGECQMDGESRTATGATGTLEFTAPEVIIPGTSQHRPTNYNEYTFASDLYSLGMICYFIVFGELPFESQLEIGQLKHSILGFALDKSSLIRKHEEMHLKAIDSRIFDLMLLLLSKNATERPAAGEVILFLEKLTDKTVQVEFISSRASNELELLKDDANFSLENEGVTADYPSVADEKTEESSAEERRMPLTQYKTILCIGINSVLTIMILSSSTASLTAHFSLILLGISLKTSLKSQKWILLALCAILMMDRYSRASN